MIPWGSLSIFTRGLILLVAAGLIYWGVAHALGEVKQAGYTQAQADDKKLLDGKDVEIASLKQQIAAANDQAHATKEQHDADNRQREQQAAARQAETEAKAAKELANEKAAHDQFVADLYAGRIRLRIPATDTANAGGDRQLPGTSTAAGGRDDGGTCELPGGTAADLARLTDRANNLAIALNKYKKIAINDRLLCNGP